MVTVTRKDKIYVICPAAHATGGTELLHQLAFKLRMQGIDAVMHYSPSDHPNPVPNEFRDYQVPFERTIDDHRGNVVVVPEVDSFRIFKLHKVRRVMWWLSVDNFYKALKDADWYKRGIKRLMVEYGIRRLVSLHLAQSMYAYTHLKEKGIANVEILSDYLNKDFIGGNLTMENRRKDMVLYNPSKGYAFTKKIIESSPEVTYVPLKGFTRVELVALLRTAKVYLDFGEHPGKDRLPREAAISGCCVITGKDGSARYVEDVPIPDGFKFDAVDESIPHIVRKMMDCLHHYENQTRTFDPYRGIILEEERKFDEALQRIFRIAQ